MFTSIKLFVVQYAVMLALAGAAVFVALLGMQTLRLKSAQLDLSHLQTSVAQDATARATATGKVNDKHRATEQKILADAAALKKADDETIAALTADASRLGRLLRNRPSRPAGLAAGPVPTASAAAGAGSSGGPGATGAQLYIEDGAFSAREAARAQRILAERNSCIAQYRQAEATLNGASK